MVHQADATVLAYDVELVAGKHRERPARHRDRARIAHRRHGQVERDHVSLPPESVEARIAALDGKGRRLAIDGGRRVMRPVRDTHRVYPRT